MRRGTLVLVTGAALSWNAACGSGSGTSDGGAAGHPSGGNAAGRGGAADMSGGGAGGGQEAEEPRGSKVNHFRET